MNWFEDQPLTDVQTAIQSQAIQTALEANTSKITDTGFQSFLTNAPIPRMYNVAPFTSAHPNASNVVMTFNAATTLDPDKTFDGPTGTWTCPIDGFYHHWFEISATGTLLGFLQLIFLSSAGGSYSSGFVNNSTGLALYQGEINAIIPHSAGDTVRLQLGNNGAGALSSMTTVWGSVWQAPLRTYKTSAGGS